MRLTAHSDAKDISMKQTMITKAHAPKTLRLNRETVRTLTLLTDVDLTGVRGGAMHTSFSCGRDLCTTHAPG